jgi:hypothetical protein
MSSSEWLSCNAVSPTQHQPPYVCACGVGSLGGQSAPRLEMATDSVPTELTQDLYQRFAAII